MSFFRLVHLVDHASDPESLQALIDEHTMDGWELTHLAVWNLRLVAVFSRYAGTADEETVRFKDVAPPVSA